MIEELVVVEDLGEAGQPGILLPAQQPLGRAAPPEEALIAAVLEEAVRCVRRHRGAQTRRGRRLFREAEDWFFLEQRDWPFSFEQICAVLGLDEDDVRRAAGVSTRVCRCGSCR